MGIIQRLFNLEGGFMAAGISEELDELRNISRNSKQLLNEMLLNEVGMFLFDGIELTHHRCF